MFLKNVAVVAAVSLLKGPKPRKSLRSGIMRVSKVGIASHGVEAETHQLCCVLDGGQSLRIVRAV